MTRIQIDRLRLENFKCHRNLELFFCGQNAVIYGDNAVGKTSVYDALLWLLFGKDSAGNEEKNFDVKPLDAAGAVADHNAITSVEAALLVAGVPVTLKRTYREVWSTKRGSSKESFDGNTSEYYVDGVPCKKNAFDNRIREIVPEDTFHLLTSVSFFSRDLHWQKRRAVLFDMAGTMSDREIMATDSRFLPLSQALGNLSLDDYRRKLAAEKKQLTGVKTDTPARISECQKTVEDLEGIDYDAVSAEIGTMEQEANRVAAQIQAMGESQTERQRTELAHLERQLLHDETLVRNWESDIAATKQSINDSRSRWIAVNQESAREAARCLEAVEETLFLIDEFTRYKADFLEDAVNSRFQLARFRLFRAQANGGIEDWCDVVLDGVPYNGLNNGTKINVGIDIINTLSRHFGVAVPLFVDNAESVTRLEYAATQVIRLVVSESDKELRCEYEN